MVPANLAEVNWTCDLTNYLRSDLLRNKEISVLTFMNLKREREGPQSVKTIFTSAVMIVLCVMCVFSLLRGQGPWEINEPGRNLWQRSPGPGMLCMRALHLSKLKCRRSHREITEVIGSKQREITVHTGFFQSEIRGAYFSSFGKHRPG